MISPLHTCVWYLIPADLLFLLWLCDSLSLYAVSLAVVQPVVIELLRLLWCVYKNVTGHTWRSFSNVSVTSEPSYDVIAASERVKPSSGTTHRHTHADRQADRQGCGWLTESLTSDSPQFITCRFGETPVFAISLPVAEWQNAPAEIKSNLLRAKKNNLCNAICHEVTRRRTRGWLGWVDLARQKTTSHCQEMVLLYCDILSFISPFSF